MKERIFFLDYAKVICTFLVVFAHLYTGESAVRLFIYSFHMPFFFLVSGMFHKELSIADSFKTNFQKIIIPTIFYVAVFIVIYIPLNFLGIIGETQGDFFGSVKYQFISLVKGLLFGNVATMPNGVCWFLIVLFYCKILYDIIRKKSIYIYVYILFFALVVIFKPKYFYIGQAIISFPFYWLGKQYKDKMISFLRNGTFKYGRILVMVMLVIVIPLINGKVSIAAISFGKCIFPIRVILFYVCALIGSFLALEISSYFNNKNKIVTEISLSLISIVGFQCIFCRLYSNIIGKDQNVLFSAVVSILIIGICIAMHNISVKCFPFVFDKRK